MIRFTTETGSVYEFEPCAVDGARIRRVAGQHQPTARVGEGWRRCVGVEALEIGESALINWGEHVPPPSKGGIPMTLTSRVLSIEGVEHVDA